MNAKGFACAGKSKGAYCEYYDYGALQKGYCANYNFGNSPSSELKCHLETGKAEACAGKTNYPPNNKCTYINEHGYPREGTCSSTSIPGNSSGLVCSTLNNYN